MRLLVYMEIRVDGVSPPSQNVLLYETVTVVEGSPILRDMVFSPDYQYTYLLSDKQILAATPSRAEIAFIVRVSERRRTRKGLDLQAAGEKKKIRSDWKSSAGLIFREHCL
ncbi:plexin A3 [Tachysurus ichikawai]